MIFLCFCSKNTDHLKAGLDLAIKQHLIVFKEASIILSHKSIRLSKSFRYVVIRNGVDLDWLQNVNTLRRLSKFLVDSTKVILLKKSDNIISLF